MPRTDLGGMYGEERRGHSIVQGEILSTTLNTTQREKLFKALVMFGGYHIANYYLHTNMHMGQLFSCTMKVRFWVRIQGPQSSQILKEEEAPERPLSFGA